MPDKNEREYKFKVQGCEIFTENDEVCIKVRKVTPAEEEARNNYFLNLTEQYKLFIYTGIDRIIGFPWQMNLTDSSFIDDKRNRLAYIKKHLYKEIRQYDVILALTACNLIAYDAKWLTFKVGTFDKEVSNWSWESFTDDIKKEIYMRVLEMNPAWIDESDRCYNMLADKFGFEKQDNFSDLAIKAQSMFSESKAYIYSLLEEINQNVFENNGTIKINLEPYVFSRRTVRPLPQNMVLVLPNKKMLNSNIYLHGHIGVVEHGRFELKIVARRDKLFVVDTEVNRIVNQLRAAINWWKSEGAYSDEEAEAISIAESAEADARSWRSEMEDLGFDEDDM